MKNLVFVFIFLSASLMAQPPLPGVDDGIVITPIDYPIAVIFALIVWYVIRVLLRKEQQIS